MITFSITPYQRDEDLFYNHDHFLVSYFFLKYGMNTLFLFAFSTLKVENVWKWFSQHLLGFPNILKTKSMLWCL